MTTLLNENETVFLSFFLQQSLLRKVSPHNPMHFLKPSLFILTKKVQNLCVNNITLALFPITQY